jgi:hypothetical protein
MKSQCRRWCGLLVTIGMIVLWSARPGLGLMITEVMYHPVGPSAAAEDETLEFIELYNNQAVSEDLGTWAFTNGIEYTFGPDTLLGPKQYLVVARDPNALKAAYGITNVVGPFTGRLNNDGERVELSNANGGIEISFRYGAAGPWPVSPDGAGHSLVLAKLGGDPEEASSWSASAYLGGSPCAPDPTQPAASGNPTTVTLVGIGTSGRYFKGSREPSPDAGGQPTTAWTQGGFDDDPATTAWLNGANGYGYSNDAGELQWIRTPLNDMSGRYISIYARLRFTLTAEQIASFSQLQAEVHYDDGFVLYLNGTRVANGGAISGNPPAYNASGGPAVTEPAMATADLTSQKGLLVAGTNVLAFQVHNSALSGSSDCFLGVTLRAMVADAGAGGNLAARLVINELLANSDAAPGADWIELYNPGPVAVDLSHIYLSDNRFNLLAHRMPQSIVLRPGEFWAVPQGAPPAGLPFALDFSGETVYVTAADDTVPPAPRRVLDAVRYGNTEPEVTFGRYPDGCDSLGCLASATFGKPNAPKLARDIVINEIMYHHATRDNRFEYIELHNRGARAISLAGWSFTDGIDYRFGKSVSLAPGSFLVVAKDPNFLAAVYRNLIPGSNLVGPYEGNLDDHRERIRLSYPVKQTNPKTGKLEDYPVTVDEVTYYDGGRWPRWADGMGASLERRDPRGDNDTPDAWADSDESGKTQWQPFSFTIDAGDSRYTHDAITVFDFMLLNAGAMLVDDLELIVGGSDRLTNHGFEDGESSWRILGNHTRSFVTTEDRHGGSRALHLIATGHGDPGANRINQSIASTTGGTVTFRGWARWLRGSRYLLLRTARERTPVMPPRPAYAFEIEMPLALGTPGRLNTALVANRGPDILEVRHTPVVPAGGQTIVITARVVDNDGVASVTLFYRYEGSAFTSTPMTDDGLGGDKVAGDGTYAAAIRGSAAGQMRAFYLSASDGTVWTRFPTRLEPSADVPERTCLIRVGDAAASSRVATYRIWMSDGVVSTVRSRPNLSNELMDCTFVYNDTDVFYNCGIRFRGSPFIRSGSNRDPRNRYGYRIEFNPDQKFRGREEINLDATEGSSRGPLQERASYWFFARMGLQYSSQEWVRLISNGQTHGGFDDVRKIDGDYIDAWFPANDSGYIHKIDDYFEYSADGTAYTNLDEGLRSDTRHPLVPETYRWHFEKRSHPEDDNWQHLFDFAVAMNTSAGDPRYEQIIESKIDPRHFTRMLAVRHAVGDWDSYGYRRGKNNAFYYALPEGKWYLLPWDIDFTLGSGDGAGTSLFSIGGQFPEVTAFLNYPKYKQRYYDALAELVNGPWKSSYGTSDPPTAFDRFLDENAAVLMAEGLGDGRRDAIKQFVRDRRNYVLSQLPVPPVTRTPKP